MHALLSRTRRLLVLLGLLQLLLLVLCLLSELGPQFHVGASVTAAAAASDVSLHAGLHGAS